MVSVPELFPPKSCHRKKPEPQAPVFVSSPMCRGTMYAGELFLSPLLFASNRCACGDTLDSWEIREQIVVTTVFCFFAVRG